LMMSLTVSLACWISESLSAIVCSDYNKSLPAHRRRTTRDRPYERKNNAENNAELYCGLSRLLCRSRVLQLSINAFSLYNQLSAVFIPYLFTRQIAVKSIWFEYARNNFFVPP